MANKNINSPAEVCSTKPTGSEKFDYISKGPEIDYKFDTSLGKYLFDRITLHNDKVAQIDSLTDKAVTFAELKKQSINTAEGLRNLGIGPKDVIAICSNLIPENSPSILGTLFIGAIVLPLDPSLGLYDIKHLLSITKPKAVFSEPECVERFEKCIRELKLKTIIIVYGPTVKHVPFSVVAEPRKINEEEFEVVNFTNPEDHIAYIMCSSGTTGLPKGVALTHKNFLAQLYTFRVLFEGLPPLKVVCTSSLYWISASGTFASLLDLGMTRVLTQSVDPEIILKVINDYQISMLGTGLGQFTALIKCPAAPKYDLSSLMMLTVYGNTLTPHHKEEGRKVFKNSEFGSGYGATETTGLCFSVLNAKPNSIGYVIRGQEAKMANKNINSPAEVCSKKPTGSEKSDYIIKGPEIDYKFDTSLGKYLFDRLTLHNDKVAQIDSLTGKAMTFAELKKQSINTAEGLRNLGIGPKDVVAICSKLLPENSQSILGTLFIGAIVLPLDTRLGLYDIKHLFNILKPKAVFSEPECIERFEKCIRELKQNTTIIVYGPTVKHVPFSVVAEPRKINVEEFEVVNFTNPEDHIAYIMCSSGTTGLPKGVALTHKNFLAQLYTFRTLFGHLPNLKFICTSTFYWISGSVTFPSLLDVGMTKVLTYSTNPEIMLKVISDYQVYMLGTDLQIFTAFTRCPAASKYDVSCLRNLTVYGDTLNPQQKETARKIFKNAEISSEYGSTETTGLCFGVENTKPCSIGYVIRGQEAKVVDLKTGKLLGPNEKGELCCRGLLVFKEYYNNPEATKQALDEEGWYKTGDLGYYDEDRCFFVEGRIKEMYHYQGWQVVPREVEKTLMKLPDIEKAAVIGIPDVEDGFRGIGFIVKRPGSNITPEEINNYLAEQLNPNKQLHGGIVFLDSLPLTPTGKVQKKSLFEMALKK